MDVSKLNPKDFEDVAWSRPENARQASKIVILGGSKDHFAEPSQIYHLLAPVKGMKITLILPQYLSKIIGKNDANIVYASSDPILGYFNKESLNEVLGICKSSDLLLIAGDMGKSSETQRLLETLLDNMHIPLVADSGALQCFADNYYKNLMRKDNLSIFLDALHFQNLLKSMRYQQAFTNNLTFDQKIDLLKIFTQEYSATLVVSDENVIWLSKAGQTYYSRSRVSSQELMVKSTPWLSWNNKDPLRTIISTLL